MAEVTGDLGGQPIQLSNAATETTLKQLLAVMMAQASKKGKQSLKEEKELRKELQALADAAKKTSAEHKKYRDKLSQDAKDKELKKAKQEQVTEYKKIGRELQNFARGIDATVKSITNFASGLASMGNSISSATQSLNAIPVVGGILATTLGAVAKEAERQQKSFQQATAVGATFSGGITEMVNSASRMGLTFDQFSGIVNRSGRDIALLGAGSADGAKQLVKYATAMRNSGLQDDLARLGFSAEDITESLAKYGAQLKTLGYSQAQIDATLVQSTGDYLKNLDAVSKITGQNRKDLEKQRADRLKDSQFRAMMIGKDKGTVDAMNALLDTMDESQAKAFREIAASGTAAGEDARALFTTAPQLAQAAMEAYNSLQTTGKYTMDQASMAHSAAQQEAKQRMDTLKFLGTYGDETQKRMALAAMNMGAQTLTLGEAVKKTEADMKAAGKNDPAEIMRLQQQTAEISNKASLALADQFSKIVPIMQKFYEILNDYVIPTFEWATDNLGLTIGALVGAKIGLEVFKGMLLKSFAGVTGGGASSILSSAIKMIFSAAGLKLLLAGGAIYGLFQLANDFAKGKSKQQSLRELDEKAKAGTATKDELAARDALRAEGVIATEGEGRRLTQRQMTVQTAKEFAASKLTDEELKEQTGWSRKVIEEYAKTKGEATIYDVAKKLGEGVTGYIEQGSTGTRTSASLPGSENTGGLGPAALDPTVLEEVNDAERERLAILEADKSLAGRRALAQAQREARERERAKEKLRLDEQIIDKTKEELETARASGACKGYDFSSPDALFKSFREKNMQPGATATPSAGGTTSTPGAPGTPGSVGGSSYSEIIGKYEGAGKYDTVFGKAGGAKINDKLITENTLAQVIAWQKENKHTNRHAAGKYGFINVEDVAKEAGISPDALFNAETQEKMQAAFTARSARTLKNLGIEATNENLALAHSVGPGGAQKLLNAQKTGQGNLTAADVLGLSGAGRTTNPQLMKPVSEVIAAHAARFKGANIPNGAEIATAGVVPVPPRAAVTPTATTASSTITPPIAPVAAGQTTPNRPGVGAPGAGGATSATEIASALERLNNMTAQIVGYNKEVAETSRLQLSALKSVGKVY